MGLHGFGPGSIVEHLNEAVHFSFLEPIANPFLGVRCVAFVNVSSGWLAAKLHSIRHEYDSNNSSCVQKKIVTH